jgi:hypothetical protein
MDWFKNLKIKTKLLVVFIFLICILVIVGAYSIKVYYSTY